MWMPPLSSMRYYKVILFSLQICKFDPFFNLLFGLEYGYYGEAIHPPEFRCMLLSYDQFPRDGGKWCMETLVIHTVVH